MKWVLIGASALGLTSQIAQARVEARFAADGALAPILAGELGAAKERVDLVLPELTDKALLAQLVQLADRKGGVQVRVVTEARERCVECDELEAHGADVRTTPTRLLHQFVLIDGPRAKKASGVLGRLVVLNGALAARDGSLLALEHEGDFVLSYQDEFNGLWSRGKDVGDEARNAAVFAVTPPPAPYTEFSSKAALSPFLAGAIEHAFDRVELSAPALKSPDVYQALARALERGVDVSVLVEAKEWQKAPKAAPDCIGMPKSAYKYMDECLSQLGADVRYTATAVRSGFLVVDAKTLYAGNYRVSKAADVKTLGNVMTLRGAVVKSFTKHFEKSFAAAKPSPTTRGPKTLAAVEPLERCVSIRPAALTFDEMQKWRAIYRKGMCD
jgi:hypothetical protein